MRKGADARRAYCRRLVLLGAMAVCLTACSIYQNSKQWLFGDKLLQRVTIDAALGANNDTPVAVDVVFVTDPDLLKTLGSLKAADWFGAREDLLRQHKDQLVVRSWEVVPGQRLEQESVGPVPLLTQGTLIFAGYPGDKSYRAQVHDRKEITILLGNSDFDISGPDASR